MYASERDRDRERKRKQKDVQAGMLKDELAVWQLIEGLPYLLASCHMKGNRLLPP